MGSDLGRAMGLAMAVYVSGAFLLGGLVVVIGYRFCCWTGWL